MSRIRQRELHARRIRRTKLAKLRSAYAEASSPSRKNQILEQVAGISPTLTPEEFKRTAKEG